MRDTKTIQRRFFDEIRVLEPAVDAAGAESGLQGLGEEVFEKMVRANVRRIAEETHVRPPTEVLVRQTERLWNQKEALKAKTRQTRESWRSASALSAALEPFRWRRWLICSLFAALIGLFLRVADIGQRWETCALLAVAAVLVGLGPWRMVPRLKAGCVEFAEFAGHMADCLRTGWIGARLALQQAALRKLELQAATLAQWEQTASDSLMSRFRTQSQRGEVAARLSNES